jgi:hypothetical protein
VRDKFPMKAATGRDRVSDQPVHGILDWKRRHANMRYHSALLLLVGTVHQSYNETVTGDAIRGYPAIRPMQMLYTDPRPQIRHHPESKFKRRHGIYE